MRGSRGGLEELANTREAAAAFKASGGLEGV